MKIEKLFPFLKLNKYKPFSISNIITDACILKTTTKFGVMTEDNPKFWSLMTEDTTKFGVDD